MGCENYQYDVQAPNRSDEWPDLPAGVPPLHALYIYVCGSCNQACRHCWIAPGYTSESIDAKQIKLEWVRKAVFEAKPLGLNSVKLTGGEPMLHSNFADLVDFVDDQGLQIHLETNGTLIDRDLAKFLKQKEHLSFISVSLDGADETTHDCLRGVPGSFNKAVEGIENLVGQGFRPQAICTLHRGNVSQLNEIIQFAEKLGCGSVKFNHVQQVGRGAHFAKKNGLRVADIIDIYRRLDKDHSIGSAIPIRFDIPFAFFSIHRLLTEDLSRCTIKNILGLLAGGELSLCGIGTTVPELIFGYIETDDLHEIWCLSPGLTQLRDKIPQSLANICSNCLHQDMCQGYCIANNYHATGKLDAAHQFCQIADDMDLFPQSRKKN